MAVDSGGVDSNREVAGIARGSGGQGTGGPDAAPCERNQVTVGKADRNQQRGGSLLRLDLAQPELQEGDGKEKGERGVLMRTRPDLPRDKLRSIVEELDVDDPASNQHDSNPATATPLL